VLVKRFQFDLWIKLLIGFDLDQLNRGLIAVGETHPKSNYFTCVELQCMFSGCIITDVERAT